MVWPLCSQVAAAVTLLALKPRARLDADEKDDVREQLEQPTREFFSALFALPRVTQLELHAVHDLGSMEELGGILSTSRIQRLSLVQCCLPRTGFSSMPRCFTQLQRFELSDCWSDPVDFITDIVIEELRKHSDTLVELVLRGDEDEILRGDALDLTAFHHMESLRISYRLLSTRNAAMYGTIEVDRLPSSLTRLVLENNEDDYTDLSDNYHCDRDSKDAEGDANYDD